MTSKFGGLGQATWDTVQDLAGQLTEVKDGAGSTLHSFGYDLAGNRTSASRGGLTGSYTFNDANQLVQMTVNGASSTLACDANGNLTDDGESTYTWDAADRLVKIEKGMHTSEFTYNGASQCVRIVEKESGTVVGDKRLLWQGGAVVAELESDGSTIRKLFYAEGELHLQDYGQFLYNRDHLGSVRQVTTPVGEVVAEFDYDPYGKATRLSGTFEPAFGLAGYYQHEPSGMSQMWFRFYSPQLGRFINRDRAIARVHRAED